MLTNASTANFRHSWQCSFEKNLHIGHPAKWAISNSYEVFEGSKNRAWKHTLNPMINSQIPYVKKEIVKMSGTRFENKLWLNSGYEKYRSISSLVF